MKDQQKTARENSWIHFSTIFVTEYSEVKKQILQWYVLTINISMMSHPYILLDTISFKVNLANGFLRCIFTGSLNDEMLKSYVC